ncbi:MAG: hypothetical protein Kow0059_22610 [Candidatus Sumerlaeia bacterium]
MIRRRLAAWLLALFSALMIAGVMGLLGLGYYLKGRSGPDFEGDLAALLPPDTPAVIFLNRPADFLNRVDKSPVGRRWARSGALEAALNRKQRLAKMQRNVARIEQFTPFRIKDRLTARWLAGSAALALVPPPRPDLPPGVILLIQADLGFEEDLAQFMAEQVPEVQVRRAAAGSGERLTRYQGSKPHRSLTLVRFGRTVALSLWSAETAYLEEVIRRRRAPAPPAGADSLAEDAVFAAWRRSPDGNRPVCIFIRPAQAARVWLEHPRMRPSKSRRRSGLQWVRDECPQEAWLSGWLDLDHNEFQARFDLNVPSPLFDLKRLAEQAPRFQALNLATTDTLAVAAVKCDDLVSLGDVLRRAAEWMGVERKDWAKADEQLRWVLGDELRAALAGRLGREAALLIQNVQTGLLIPQIDALAVAGVRDPQAIRAAMPATADERGVFDLKPPALPITLLRRAGAAVVDSPPALIVAVAPDPAAELPFSKADGASFDRPPNLAPPDEAHAIALLFVNTRRVEATLNAIYAELPPFADDWRKTLERAMMYAAVLAPFDHLKAVIHATPDGCTFRLSN